MDLVEEVLRRVMASMHCCIGKYCPKCKARTFRAKTPWYFRPFRVLFKFQSSTRVCEACGWWGITFHL